ncbi:hypothetical protein PInf_015426 [Phytophthora infestans]|nr:hypothetical protein PInf_015426 [Phytophthora infestans]
MDYNWGDPKKNSLLSSRMMAKAEVTRKKRLTSVKSTLSNQLHPAIENKLRKKKKAPDSARRHPKGDDDILPHDNNTDEEDTCKAEPQLTSDDESSTLDTVRQEVFPLPTRASFSGSMFDEFDQNAAADGLFHPASAIEAFAEHDAKYREEIKSASGKESRRARTGSEYPPSRENHRLPALPSGTTRRVSTRPESKQRASYNGSAPASLATTSSLSKLLDAGKEKRSLSAAHSDSNLYAPRRQVAVPSSADRSALDFLEREAESDNDNNAHNSPVVKSFLRTVSELDNNEVPDENNSVVPQLDFSLARKFEQLKQIMKSNREKHKSARQTSEGPSIDVCGATSSSTSQNKASSRSNQVGTKSSIRVTSSGSSATKNGGEAKPKGILKKRSTPTIRATADMNNGPRGSKHAPRATSRTTSSRTAVAKTPLIRSRKEMKARSGITLSALKSEHQEALQMLKELGGPMDPDYLQFDIDSNTDRRRSTGINRSSGSTLAHGGSKSTNQLHADSASSVSMVTKLRESISSGRSRESSPRPSSSPAVSSRRETKKDDASSLSPESNQTATQEGIVDTATALNKTALVGPEDEVPSSSPNKSSSDPWKQYGDVIGEEDGDNNTQEQDCSHVKTKPTSADRYSDDGFESDR